ncbi:peptidylprolyl isomerase [Aliiglaciecola litoralis]|uniref:Peptidyl-prolyl cis-trans isomerase n=1 Tax=Aliiglaciecola litoralis TaxID=582857 RepID=A0ABN1LLH1_9ALTE
MIIEKNTVVQFHYRIKDKQGNELESSFGKTPAAYLHGHNNMMVGIEKALAGKQTGDEFNGELLPSETFGDYVENALERVSIKHLQGAPKWQPGMTAVVQAEKGPMEVTIVKVGKFMATVDTNHPLAGRKLDFDLSVVSVREATEEEIAHGHAHGVGGHHH